MKDIKLGLAICGSFCTLHKCVDIAGSLVEKGYSVQPILSFNVAKLDTRFYDAKTLREEIEKVTGREVIDTIEGAEPIGPKRMFDVLLVLPCTGNTLAKLAHGITDTPVTMAVKSHMRGNMPVVIALSTNDGLGASYENIGRLMNMKNFYFVPYEQDDSLNKPKSLVFRKDKVNAALDNALIGKQVELIPRTNS